MYFTYEMVRRTMRLQFVFYFILSRICASMHVCACIYFAGDPLSIFAMCIYIDMCIGIRLIFFPFF